VGSFEFKAETVVEEHVSLVTLDGDLDAYSAPHLREMFGRMIAGDIEHIIVDCANVHYIDSYGLGVLVSALKQMSDRSGSFILACLNDAAKRTLRVTGLDQLFVLCPDMSQARAACGLPG
jgi:anti-sigma B factor antagonist